MRVLMIVDGIWWGFSIHSQTDQLHCICRHVWRRFKDGRVLHFKIFFFTAFWFAPFHGSRSTGILWVDSTRGIALQVAEVGRRSGVETLRYSTTQPWSVILFLQFLERAWRIHCYTIEIERRVIALDHLMKEWWRWLGQRECLFWSGYLKSSKYCFVFCDKIEELVICDVKTSNFLDCWF